jgi:competence protein ComEA
MLLKKLLCALAMLLAQTAFAAVDVNKADQSTLETVKGIGSGVSSRILDERKKGTFKDWADLVDRVKGVGDGNAARFSKEGLTVNGVTFTPSASSAKPADKKFGRTEKKSSGATE